MWDTPIFQRGENLDHPDKPGDDIVRRVMTFFRWMMIFLAQAMTFPVFPHIPNIGVITTPEKVLPTSLNTCYPCPPVYTLPAPDPERCPGLVCLVLSGPKEFIALIIQAAIIRWSV